MALKRKHSIYHLFVLLLGLVSCSKDKEVVYQPVRAETQNVGAMDSQKRMMWAKNIRSLELGGSLVIDLLEQQNFQANPIVVRVQSWCQSDSAKGSLVNDVYFQNQFSIPILKILSRDALLSTSKNPLTCDMTLTITETKTAAVSIYPLPAIVIQNSPTFSNIAFFDDTANVFVYNSIKAEPLPDGDSWTLACTDFQKNMSQESNITLEKIMSSSTTNLNNWQNSQQTCRLLIENRENIFLSRPFELAFEPQALVMNAELLKMQTVFGPLEPHPVLKLQVMNPNPYPVQFKMTKLDQSNFLFRPVYAGGFDRGLLGDKHVSTLKWTFEKTLVSKSIETDSWIFNLLPQQTITLLAESLETYDCGGLRAKPPTQDQLASGLRLSPIYLNRPAYAGIQFGFSFNTQFLTRVTDETWAANDLQSTALSALLENSTPYWDIDFHSVKYIHGIAHAAKNNEEFITYIKESFDLCKPL